MAEITIRLRANARTGRTDIMIDYHSDADAMPIEHEREHRRIVESLLGRGVLSRDAVGEVVVRRVEPSCGDAEDQTTRETGQLKVGE